MSTEYEVVRLSQLREELGLAAITYAEREGYRKEPGLLRGAWTETLIAARAQREELGRLRERERSPAWLLVADHGYDGFGITVVEARYPEGLEQAATAFSGNADGMEAYRLASNEPVRFQARVKRSTTWEIDRG